MNELDRERRALRLFEQMVDLDPARRERWLADHGGSDPEVRERVSSLARLHGAGTLLTGGAVLAVDTPAMPERVGAYRITGLIGIGGMGAVYAATRDRGDFAHDVAIKLIKPGLLSHRLSERFARERQLLARLNHPNIARLFDGGETKDGQPFIVMERVKGETLPAWLERTSPPLGKRLGLFLQICNAVGYSHRHFVVHRDLTPTNVLVDRDCNAKLIDFGIARPDGDEALPAEVERDDGLVRLSITPGYVAPERLDGSLASTLGDIYSAGRLLKLLTDCERSRDLQAIVAKATAEVPEQRYHSMEQLADDVQRFINGEAVSAVPLDRVYITRKWIARNRPLAVSLAALALAVLTGSAATLWKWQEAEASRSEATARLADTRNLANVMMFDALDELGKNGGSTQAKLLMAQNAQRYLYALASDSQATFDARFAAAEGYQRLGLLTGGPDNANVGELLDGLRLLESSHAILLALMKERPEDRTRQALAASHLALMQMKGRSYLNTEQAIEHGRRAHALLEKLPLDSPEAVSLAARVDRHLGDMLGCCTTEPRKGSDVISEGLQLIDDAPALIRAAPEVRRARNDLVNLSAGFKMLAGQDRDGLPIFRKALTSQRALMAKTGHPDDRELEAVIATNFARTLLRMGRVAEADRVIAPTHTRALEDFKSDKANNTIRRRLAVITLARAWIAAARGEKTLSREYLRDGLDFARTAEWPAGFADVPSLNFAHRLQEASEAYRALGDSASACAMGHQSLAMYSAYSSKLKLPLTTLRYRISRILDQSKECNDGLQDHGFSS